MRNTLLLKGILSISILLFAIPVLTYSEEKNISKIQGTVMELYLKQNTMVVSEKTFVWNEKTIFKNEKGSPITVDKLKIKNWVYIEGEYDNAKKRTLVRKIYLLPKYIGQKERHLYSFFQDE